MPFISASIDTFLITCGAVVVPTYTLLKRRQSKSQAPYRHWLTLLVTVHTVYIVYVLTIQWPPNLFSRLRIPLTMPSNGIRTILLQRAELPPDSTLPAPLETLLTRLSSFDSRSAYVRFGQSVLQDCQHCKTLDQYALYAIAAPLTEYVREGVIAGFLTMAGSHHGRWRIYAIIALVAGGLLEAYLATATPVHIPRDGGNVFMLHDNLWLARQLFFLLLPIIVHALPPSAPLDPISAILATRNTLEMTLRRLAYLKFLHGAVLRNPSLQTSASQWWAEQREAGQAVREDSDIQATAEKLGSGFEEGLGEAKFLPRMREAAAQLKAIAFAPPVPPMPPAQK